MKLKRHFFSLILDSTQDISKTDQMTIVIRHVPIDSEEDKLKIEESFLGFVPLNKETAEEFAVSATKFLETHGISLKKCRGQGYDGAWVMSGQYGGLQALIKKNCKNADYFIYLFISYFFIYYFSKQLHLFRYMFSSLLP